jgi:MFS family permease
MTLPFLELCILSKDSPLNSQSFGTPTGQRLGTITNGMRFGQVAALFVIAPLVQKFGRRVPIAIGSSILLVGVILQTAAQNYGMFVVGRCE